MRYTILAVFAAFLLAGCQSGPGAACDECATAEAGVADVAPFGQAAAAAASGGQRASNQPMQMDPARINPHTAINRGAGPLTTNTNQRDARSQAGAPSVNQGLVLPTSAEANTGAGVPPAVQELQEYSRDLRAQLALAMANGDGEARTALLAEIRGVLNMMAEVSATNRASTTNNYNFNGARIVQSVANGSKSGDAPGGAIDADGAKAVATPLAEAAKAVMGAGEASDVPPAGDVPDPLAPVEGGGE